MSTTEVSDKDEINIETDDYNFSSNAKAEVAFYDIIGLSKKRFFRSVPQHYSPGHNLNSDLELEKLGSNELSKFPTEFPFKASYPVPLLPPKPIRNHASHTIQDPTTTLVTEKKKWQQNVDGMKTSYTKHLGDKPKPRLKKSDSIPKLLVDCAEALASDPDPQFNGTYNWYYTGGTLQCTTVNGQEILLQASGHFGEYLSVIPITPYKSGFQADLTNNAKTKTKKRTPIYEIKSEAWPNTTLLGTRKKYNVTLYKMNEIQLSPEKIHSFKSSDSYTSFCFNKYYKDRICLANTERFVCLYDINSQDIDKSIFGDKVAHENSLSDKWNSVKFLNENQIIFTDRRCVSFIDTRNIIDSVCFKADTFLDRFEEITNFHISKISSNSIYLNTNHSVYMLDIRNINKSNPVQKWIHMMKSAPLILDSVIVEDSELLCLSSQYAEELSLIVNKFRSVSDYQVTTSHILPWRPPSILNSFTLSQLNGKCLNPNSRLKERLELNTSGCLLMKGKRVSLLTQNAVGDVFQQILKPRHENINTNYVPKRMSAFCRAIMKLNKPYPLHATSIVNMEQKFKILKQKKYKSEESSKTPEVVSKNLEKWQRTLTDLSEYRDVLAASLLEPWGYMKYAEPELEQRSTSTKEMVSAWLEKSNLEEIAEHPQTEFLTQPLSVPTVRITEQNTPTEYNRGITVRSQPTPLNILSQSEIVFMSQPTKKVSVRPQRKRQHNEGF